MNIACILVVVATLVVALPAAQPIMKLGPIENVQFGPLLNAPNGHISFRRDDHGFTAWLPGGDVRAMSVRLR